MRRTYPKKCRPLIQEKRLVPVRARTLRDTWGHSTDIRRVCAYPAGRGWRVAVFAADQPSGMVVQTERGNLREWWTIESVLRWLRSDLPGVDNLEVLLKIPGDFAE